MSETKELQSEWVAPDGKQVLKIYHDLSGDCGNPRENDNLGIIHCEDTKRYTLGDKHVHAREEIEKVAVVCLPVYVYDHGGLTVSTKPFNIAWDSGMAGVIYTTKEQLDMMGLRRMSKAKLRKQLKSELGEYDDWLTGEVYGYELYDVARCDLGHAHLTQAEQCWGFVGSKAPDWIRDEQGAQAWQAWKADGGEHATISN